MKQKKTLKKAVLVIMAFMMICVSVPFGAQAAGKTKLSKKSATVYVGKTVTIKLLNNSKKVKWSVSNGKIRITKKTKKYVKVKGVKKGSSYVKAKVGKKTYKCKITVKTQKGSSKDEKVKFDEKEAKKQISKKRFLANGKLYVEISSKYKYPTDVSAKCTFYDSSGQPIDYWVDSISYLEKGHKGYLRFTLPDVKYSKYEIEYTYSEGLKYLYHLSVIEDLELETNYVNDEYNPYIMLQVSNSGDEQCYYCEVSVVYYDENGKIVDVSKEAIGSIAAGSNATEKSYIPYDETTFEDIPYDHYKAFISYAYHLGKKGETN